MINKSYEETNEFIKNINKQILGTKDDIYYIANNTLTRNPFASKILSNEETTPNLSNKLKIKFLIRYFLKAFSVFFVYLVKFIIYKSIKKKTTLNYKILIDTYFLVDKIDKTKSFKDSYFLGLDDLLQKDQFAYLVKSFYGSVLNIKKFLNVVKVINQSDKNIISEFDIIGFGDLLKAFCFILIYPFKIIRVYKHFKGDNLVFDYSLIESLNGSDFLSYIRYLLGKKINKQNNIEKIISWCEYQNIDKSFYKGVNESGKNQTIYGCQFLVTYDSWLNFFIPKEEERFNLCPDILLTNGKFYLEHIEIEKRLGVSLRYSHLFNENNNQGNSNDKTLVLGSFIFEETLNLIEMVKKLQMDDKIILRLHPTQSFDMYKNKIPESWILSDKESLDEAMSKSNIVITNGGTGTSLETVCKGKSTLIVGNSNNFNSLPLINKGQGEIWDLAFNKNEVIIKYNDLLKYRNNNKDKIDELSSWYKENFFINPSKKKILEIFDLAKE